MNAPGRPRFLAAPLLAAAIVLFWLCFALPEWLMPRTLDEKRLAWPEGAAQSVRRVVVDQSQTEARYVPGIRLQWSATQAPEIKIDRAVGGEAGASVDLQVKGDTLYIRPRADAAQQARVPEVNSITLPMQVAEVQACSLHLIDTSCQPCGQKPDTAEKDTLPALTLRGQRIAVVGETHIGQLHIDATDSSALCPKEEEESRSSWLEQPDIEVNARHVQALRIRAAVGSLDLREISHLDTVPVTAPGKLKLKLDRIEDAHRVRWQPLPP